MNLSKMWHLVISAFLKEGRSPRNSVLPRLVGVSKHCMHSNRCCGNPPWNNTHMFQAQWRKRENYFYKSAGRPHCYSTTLLLSGSAYVNFGTSLTNKGSRSTIKWFSAFWKQLNIPSLPKSTSRSSNTSVLKQEGTPAFEFLSATKQKQTASY